MELAQVIPTDTKGLVRVSTEKSDKSFDNSEKVTDKTHNWFVGIADEKPNGTVVTIFFEI